MLCFFYLFITGAVGLPFRYVNFMIGEYNAYVKGEYEVIVEGNDEEVKVTEGPFSTLFLSINILSFSLLHLVT